jgi:hypothetical protein
MSDLAATVGHALVGKRRQPKNEQPALLQRAPRRTPTALGSYRPVRIENAHLVGTDVDRLAGFMHNWQRWMKLGGRTGGWPSRASGGIGVSGSKDIGAMEGESDAYFAMAVDAIVQELPVAQRVAVYVFHDLADEGAHVFRFPRNNKAELYTLALAQVQKGLVARGLW